MVTDMILQGDYIIFLNFRGAQIEILCNSLMGYTNITVFQNNGTIM